MATSATSSKASARALPLSHCTRSRSALRSARTRSWNALRMRERRGIGVAAHSPWAVRARAAAAATSAAVWRGREPMRLPVRLERTSKAVGASVDGPETARLSRARRPRSSSAARPGASASERSSMAGVYQSNRPRNTPSETAASSAELPVGPPGSDLAASWIASSSPPVVPIRTAGTPSASAARSTRSR